MELLLPTACSEEQRQNLELVLQLVNGVGSLTSRLLAFVRRGPVGPEDARTEVAPFLQQLEPVLASVVGPAVRLEMDLGPDLGWVPLDSVELEQIMLNLAVNARNVMPDGGSLRVRARTTPAEKGEKGGLETGGTSELERPAPGTHVRLEVEDTGSGMDAASAELAFEPFFTTRPGGTGLGLAAVSQLVEQAGGRIGIHGAAGRGTEFRILLPRLEDAAGPRALG